MTDNVEIVIDVDASQTSQILIDLLRETREIETGNEILNADDSRA